MKAGYRHIVIITDESGSMGNCVSDTIGGMQTLAKTQAKDSPNSTLTTVFFEGGNVKTIHDFTTLSEVKDEDFNVYQPLGSTNLLDAIGQTVTKIGKTLSDMKEEDRPEKVIVSIITDGQENSSYEYTSKQIKEMIKTQEEVYSWDFSFVSEDINALEQAKDYGFQSGKMALYSKDCTAGTFNALSSKISRSAEGGDEDYLECELSAMVSE
jgi:uncharacterized protein YegL